MVKVYAALVKKGLKTINEVPANIRAEVAAITHRPEAVLEALRCARNAVRMCNASAGAMLAVKLILVILAGAGGITIWFAAAFELIATLFVKIFSASAYDEKSLERFSKKTDTNRKEKAE